MILICPLSNVNNSSSSHPIWLSLDLKCAEIIGYCFFYIYPATSKSGRWTSRGDTVKRASILGPLFSHLSYVLQFSLLILFYMFLNRATVAAVAAPITKRDCVAELHCIRYTLYPKRQGREFRSVTDERLL